MNGQRSVLIVDRSQETREVLQTVLERRGVRTLAAGRAEMGVELAQRHHPDLIVLDVETCGAGVPPALGGASETPVPQYQPRLILLGSLRGRRNRLLGGECVSKPYHYGLLIRRIEELLGVCDTRSMSLDRADAVRHPRCRPGQPLRADRACHPAGAGPV